MKGTARPGVISPVSTESVGPRERTRTSHLRGQGLPTPTEARRLKTYTFTPSTPCSDLPHLLIFRHNDLCFGIEGAQGFAEGQRLSGFAVNHRDLFQVTL